MKLKNTVFQGLLLACFLAWSPFFYLPFQTPKFFFFLITAVFCIVYLLSQESIFVPDTKTLLFIGAVFLACCLSLISAHAKYVTAMHIAYFVCAVLIFMTVINLPELFLFPLLRSIYFLAMGESILAFAQFVRLSILPKVLLVQEQPNTIGTLGNPEFLATFLGFSFLLGFILLKDRETVKDRALFLVCQSVLFFGVAVTRSKGTLFLLAAFLLWQKRPQRKTLLVLMGCLSLGCMIFLFPDSVKGRALLWISSLFVLKTHFLFGVGLGQIGGYYLDGVSEFFTQFPLLARTLERHSASIVDAHNLLLNFGAEIGIGGLVLSGIFVYGGFKKAALLKESPFRWILVFLLVKSMYTVLYSAVSSVLLLILVLGLMERGRLRMASLRYAKVMKSVATLCLALIAFAGYVASADVYYKRGMDDILVARLDKAQVNLSRALKMNSHSSDFYLAKAHVYFLEKDLVRMKENIRKALWYGKNRNSLRISAHMYYYSGLYDDAFPLYQFLNKVYPQHLTSMTKLAQIYLYRGDDKMAHEFASRVIDEVPRLDSDTDFKNRLIASQIINETGPKLYNGRIQDE